MITELLLDFLFLIIELLLAFVPTFDFLISDKLAWVVSQVVRFTEYAGYFLPLNDMLLVLSGILVVTNFQFILWIVNWVIRRIADIIP